MKLLLDENLSFRLLAALADAFPGSLHVRDIGLARADDLAIWNQARDKGFAIVTLDSDFYDIATLRGWPPKIVWLRSLDTSTAAIASVLDTSRERIAAFLTDADSACLMITAATAD